MENVKYTEKLMKNFMKPKNIGEIKNADAIGVVGNPVCLLPNEKVLFEEMQDEIKNFDKHHLVFSHDLSRNKIINRSKRDYNGQIIKIKNCLGNISLTPEHLIYAIKLPKETKYLRTENRKKLIPAWYHAQDLVKRDIVLYPLDLEEADTIDLVININKSKWDFRSKKIKNKIILNNDLLRLFGYFLAEGNIQEKPSKTYISFTLNINERSIVGDIRKIIKNIFNLDVKVSERPDTNAVVVYLYNAHLARWFKSLFGNGAESKKIPEFIMRLPKEKQNSLVFGLWKGDGYINLKRDGPRAGYATISYDLVQQIKTLLLRQGIIPSIYTEEKKTSRWANHKKAYRIHVGQRESLIKLCKILKEKYSPKSYSANDSWISNNFLYTPITNIKKERYSGQVYNMEVENKHSYLTNAFAIHNCGDVMKLYIKVGKKKIKGKEKEYIKDIKFQTFGCAAAIGTSSMITQLAKGKTIEEAEKITNKNIACSLGGLPNIKMHCSNLAEEGLKKAIANYKNRKGGK